MTTERIVVQVAPGQALQDVVPLPSGQRAQLAEYLEMAGFVREIREAGTGSGPAVDGPGPDATARLRIVLDSGFTAVRDGDERRIFDVYERLTAAGIDRYTLQQICDDVQGWGIRLVANGQERHGHKLVWLDLVDTRLLTR